MARLATAVREKMAEALVAHRYADEGKRLVSESADLFRKLYDWHYDATTQRQMAAIEKKHPRGLWTTNGFRAVVSGQRIAVGEQSFGKKRSSYVGYWKCEIANRRALSDLGDLQVPQDHPLADRILTLGRDGEKLKADTSTAFTEAMSALNQFGTAKRLSEGWPEAMPLVGNLIPDGERTLPVVQVSALNNKFDLPPSERLAA